MRKLHYILIIVCMHLATQHRAQQLSQDPLYELKFFDEFDALSLDTTQWFPQYPWSSTFNNSDRMYPACTVTFPDSIVPLAFNYPYGANINANRGYDTVGTGYHTLKCKRESTPVQGYIWDYSANPDTIIPKEFKYTTAMLYSKYKFKFGYFEIKYRLSNINSSSINSYGPNFWLWANDANTYWSEIDIYEQRGSDWKKGPNTAYRLTSSSTTFIGNQIYSDPFTDPANTTNNGGTWHVSGCEWTPDYADFYYDDNDMFRRYADNLTYVGDMTAMNIIADVYMPSFQFCIAYDTVNTQQPFNYDIDYIKAYQLKYNCISKTFLNTSSSTYADTLWQDLTIGGSGGSAVFNSNTHHLAGQDFVILQEGFEVSGANTALIISTKPCPTGQTMSYTPISTTPSSNSSTIINVLNQRYTQ